MSALSDFEPERADVILSKGKPLSVRGLSVDDLSALIRNHFDTAKSLFSKFDGKFDAAFLTTALSEGSLMCAHIIALAADDPKALRNAMQLPFPIQLELVKVIGGLTFESVGGPGNALAALGALLKSEANRLTSGQQPDAA
jgi:hypothetical protein